MTNAQTTLEGYRSMLKAIDTFRSAGFSSDGIREIFNGMIHVQPLSSVVDPHAEAPHAGLEYGWTNQLVLGKSRFADYSWEQMMEGSVNGGRHSWLKWCRDNRAKGWPLSNPVFQNRVRYCLAFGYDEDLASL